MSRKRPAPGTEPLGTSQLQPSSYHQLSSPLPNGQAEQWSQAMSVNANAGYPDTQDLAMNSYQKSVPSLTHELSNQVARRDPTQLSLAQYNSNSTWPVPYQTPRPVGEMNDTGAQSFDDDLDRRAEIAERNAISNRKSIPPFVQKLSSFLDEASNEDLIRWSDSGDSFIVLDEDEFAKKLIPELFKHNKYASFVRQLNMYGFHKKVGLSDNSMRASERKSKSPSEYFNPYFKRGRPKLLWLIQKPKQAGKKAGQNQEGGDDDEDMEIEGGGMVPGDRNPARQSLALPKGTKGLTQEQVHQLQDELTAIRRNQATIQEEVQKLREENDMMHSRAAQYQAIHHRHENSINAILTFLATVYRNQLEGREAQPLASLFPGTMPRDDQHNDRVVDLGGYNGRENSTRSRSQTRNSRRPLLLEAPSREEDVDDEGHGRITSASTPGATAPPTTTTEAPPLLKRESSDSLQHGDGRLGRNGSQGVKQEPIHNDDILSMLNSANAGPGGAVNCLNYPQALSQLQAANRKSPMSTPQRNSILQLMANGEARNALDGGNNALTSPSPPPIPGPLDPHWEARNENINALERSISEQENRFNNISALLQPLSPSSSIPGFDENVPPPSDLNFDFSDDWLNMTSGADLGNNTAFDNSDIFDFKGFDNPDNGISASQQGDSDEQHGMVMGTAGNSEATSPANTVATIEDGASEGQGGEYPDSPRKKQRLS